MKKLIKLFLIATLFIITNNGIAKQDNYDKDFKIKLCKLTSEFFNKQGIDRNWESFYKFANASVKTTVMFPDLPITNNNPNIDDRLERILNNYTMAAQESYFRYNYVNVNIPEIKYSNGKVKKFSLDWTCVGINDENVERAYIIAKDIQENKKIPNRIANPQFKKALEHVWIPKDIVLRKIDTSQTKSAKQWYFYYKKHGVKPYDINKLISKKIVFKETTQDEIDSAYIYRLIVETERANLGWKHSVKNEALYKWLLEKMK